VCVESEEDGIHFGGQVSGLFGSSFGQTLIFGGEQQVASKLFNYLPARSGLVCGALAVCGCTAPFSPLHSRLRGARQTEAG